MTAQIRTSQILQQITKTALTFTLLIVIENVDGEAISAIGTDQNFAVLFVVCVTALAVGGECLNGVHTVDLEVPNLAYAKRINNSKIYQNLNRRLC